MIGYLLIFKLLKMHLVFLIINIIFYFLLFLLKVNIILFYSQNFNLLITYFFMFHVKHLIFVMEDKIYFFAHYYFVLYMFYKQVYAFYISYIFIFFNIEFYYFILMVV